MRHVLSSLVAAPPAEYHQPSWQHGGYGSGGPGGYYDEQSWQHGGYGGGQPGGYYEPSWQDGGFSGGGPAGYYDEPSLQDGDYGGGEYHDETSWQDRGYGGGEGTVVEGEEEEAPADYGEVDPRLGQGKDPALGPDIVDGLRDVHDKIHDVREALNMYRIVKADGSRAMQQLERMPRQMPGGVPWASALDLEHVVEKTKYIPAADFDNLINGMHVMQLSLADTLRNYLMKKAAAHEAARESMSEAAESMSEAAEASCCNGALVSVAGGIQVPDAVRRRLRHCNNQRFLAAHFS